MARWTFQKTILLNVFLQSLPVYYTGLILNLRDTLSKDVSVRTGRFILSFHRLREKFSFPVLAEFVFAVGQGRIPTMGRPCYGFSYQSSSGSEINGQPYHVCCGSTGQVVSSRDPFHVTHIYRAPPPATWLVGIYLKRKKVKQRVHPDLSSTLNVTLKSDLWDAKC